MVEHELQDAPSVSADTKAFEILVRRHHRRLLAYATSILIDENTARDVVQDAFVVAYRRLADFDASKDFSAWMRGIVRHQCQNTRRAQRRMILTESTVLDNVETQHRVWDANEAENNRDTMRAMHTCLARLPETLQQAVNLFYMQKLSGAEVARRIGLQETTVRKRLQRARKSLGDCITQTLEASA